MVEILFTLLVIFVLWKQHALCTVNLSVVQLKSQAVEMLTALRSTCHPYGGTKSIYCTDISTFLQGFQGTLFRLHIVLHHNHAVKQVRLRDGDWAKSPQKHEVGHWNQDPPWLSSPPWLQNFYMGCLFSSITSVEASLCTSLEWLKGQLAR